MGKGEEKGVCSLGREREREGGLVKERGGGEKEKGVGLRTEGSRERERDGL